MQFSSTKAPHQRKCAERQLGVTSVEYALLAAVLSLALIAGMTATGDANAGFITAVKDVVLQVLGIKSAALGG